MGEQRRARHLRVVRTAPLPRGAGSSTDGDMGVDVGVGADLDESHRAAYWAQVKALRAERQRLNAS